MGYLSKKERKIIIGVLVLIVSAFVVSTAWAALTLIDTKEIQAGENLRAGVMAVEQTVKAKTRAPEPSTLVLFGSGILGMFVSFVRKTYIMAKRVFDVVISVIAVIVLSPLFIVTALLVKCTSKGSIFYKQTRVGKDWKLFDMYKFRTMRVDAEKLTGPVWAAENDSRLIPVGKFLRKTHIDEIPQFFNILRGDMSFIGPRPERPLFVEKLKKEICGYEKRLQVKPGLTGLAQVWNRYDETIHDVRKKIKYDILYIKRMCLWTDLRIFLRTFRVVFTGEGAR
ncbi:MAG: exopolysaccharide biosynthesis polyprenyl glycosylphosphotransferase [Candidatus Omnitrophica bacterium]|nr:exopolysaccharide biosynthesis polyprenyl glycosylphosphotransferase [Candidatus Omnitrophota bacterium]